MRSYSQSDCMYYVARSSSPRPFLCALTASQTVCVMLHALPPPARSYALLQPVRLYVLCYTLFLPPPVLMRSYSQSDCMYYVTRSSSPRPFLCALTASQTVCIMLHALPPPARSYALLQPVRLYVLCYTLFLPPPVLMRSYSQSDCMYYVARSSSPRPFLCALTASQTVCVMLHALPPPARSYALLQPVRLYVLCYTLFLPPPVLMRSYSQSDCMYYVTRSSSPRPFLCALTASQTVCIMLHALPPPARSYALLQPVRLYVLCYTLFLPPPVLMRSYSQSDCMCVVTRSSSPRPFLCALTASQTVCIMLHALPPPARSYALLQPVRLYVLCYTLFLPPPVLMRSCSQSDCMRTGGGRKSVRLYVLCYTLFLPPPVLMRSYSQSDCMRTGGGRKSVRLYVLCYNPQTEQHERANAAPSVDCN